MIQLRSDSRIPPIADREVSLCAAADIAILHFRYSSSQVRGQMGQAEKQKMLPVVLNQRGESGVRPTKGKGIANEACIERWDEPWDILLMTSQLLGGIENY